MNIILKDEWMNINLNSQNSKSYFYEAVWEFFDEILNLQMSVEETPMSLLRHFSHNVVCFPVTFSLLASAFYFVSLLLYPEQK